MRLFKRKPRVVKPRVVRPLVVTVREVSGRDAATARIWPGDVLDVDAADGSGQAILSFSYDASGNALIELHTLFMTGGTSRGLRAMAERRERVGL